jgi:hypothetical protein
VDRVDKPEARSILRELLDELRRSTYAELKKRLDEVEVREVVGSSGAVYQVEIEAFWDDKRQGNLRVLAAIDGGGWRAFAPLTDSFIVAPDGGFVGE